MNHVSNLSESLPHRDHMVWIDYVMEAHEDGGVCLVTVDPQKHYFSDSGVRQSAFIEWMAQGYGFVCAEYYAKLDVKQTLEKAFLVGVEKMNFSGKMPVAGEEILISVKKIRMVGPISYVEGKISSRKTGMVYTESVIKLFSA